MFPALFSCNDDLVTQTGILTRDCTGTYLTLQTIEYKICNPELVDLVPENDTINVSLKHVTFCSDNFACQLFHPFEGFVKIKDVL